MCKGAGHLRADVPYGHPLFGRLLPCPSCKTQETDERNRDDLERKSNIDAFRHLTFETYDPKIKGVKMAYDTARAFAQDPTNWLGFFGPFGSGKTHLAAAIANQVLGLPMPVYFGVVPDLLDHLRAAFAPNAEGRYDERFDYIKNVPLLVLDDLGTEKASDWAKEKLYQLINHRYNLRMPTIFTSNQDIDRLDGRVASRLKDVSLCRLYYIDGDDYRMRPLSQRRHI